MSALGKPNTNVEGTALPRIRVFNRVNQTGLNLLIRQRLSLGLQSFQLIKSRTLPYSKLTHFTMATHGVLQSIV